VGKSGWGVVVLVINYCLLKPAGVLGSGYTKCCCCVGGDVGVVSVVVVVLCGCVVVVVWGYHHLNGHVGIGL